MSAALGPVAGVSVALLVGLAAIGFWMPSVFDQGAAILAGAVDRVWAAVQASTKEMETAASSMEAEGTTAIQEEEDIIQSSHSDRSHSGDNLVEIQAESPPAVKPSPFVQRKYEVGRSSWAAGKSNEVVFLGNGLRLKHAGVAVDSPLVYFVDGKLRDPYDASLIESRLDVAGTGRGAYQLPYWPSYRECSPYQRRNYLVWLAGGRRDPYAELGYVFIFFYGLERRVLMDRSDHNLVIQEVLRLLPIYGNSNSFKRYATGLLWAALITHPKLEDLPGSQLDAVIQATPYWNEDNIAAMLAAFKVRGERLQAKSAMLVTQHDPRTQRSIVIRRHEEKFEELFRRRFVECFPDGIELRSAKRAYVLRYRPASATLSSQQFSSCFEITFPDVPGIPSQFAALVDIWNSAIDDLRAFDRAYQKTDRDELTAEMYEALPSELRRGDHPQFEAWYGVISRYTDKTGSFVPIHELATIRGVPQRQRLTKKQSEDLLNSAECMDLCLEPDARETGQSYKWDAIVSVFPREYESGENMKSYHAASILLRLGMSIAHADGTVDDAELKSITSQLERLFELAPQESVRLEHLAALLARYPEDTSQLSRKLQALNSLRREAIGEYLVAIAGADGVITVEELKTLQKLYRNLGLDSKALDKLKVGAVEVEDEPTPTSEFLLDEDRIRRILAETRQVADFLQDVMLDDDGEERVPSNSEGLATPAEQSIPAPNTSTPQFIAVTDSTQSADQAPPVEADELGQTRSEEPISEYAGLSPRFHSFLTAVLSQPEWSRVDLTERAREQSLMLNGAIEAINEWTLELYGDWLLDDQDDVITVSISLLSVKNER